MTDATTVAATYFDAWRARDFARLRSVLADGVDFAGRTARSPVSGWPSTLGASRAGRDRGRHRGPLGLNSGPKRNGPALSQPSRG